MKKKKNILIYIMAFVIPFGILSLSFALLKVYPFGNRQVLVVDAWNQYYPFLVELNRKLRSGESLLYSWRLGLGSDFVSLMAYYLASPLNLLLFLFPESILKEIFTLFILIKTGLAGSLCAYALIMINEKKEENRGNKGNQRALEIPESDKRRWGVILFSTFYALCGWNIGYYWNLMWLDTFALLPLVALGIYLLVKEKRFKLYTLSLALAILANYYIGLMVCIFTAVFFFTQCFIRQNNRKELWKNLKNIMLYSILAILMSAAATLPTMITLGHAYKSNSGPAKQLTARGWTETFSNLFAYLEPTQMGGRPYLYCGVLCILLLIVYCRLPKVSRREKGAYLLAVLLVFASTNVNLLNYIWHGFHGANSLPYRFTFIFAFLVMIPAHRAYLELDSLRKKDWKIVCAGGIVCWLLVAADRLYRYGKENDCTSAADLFRAEGKDIWPFLIKNLLLITAYLVLLAFLVWKKQNKKVLLLLLAVTAGLELVPTVLAGTRAMGTTDRDGFPDRYTQVEEALTGTKAIGTTGRADFPDRYTQMEETLTGTKAIGTTGRYSFSDRYEQVEEALTGTKVIGTTAVAGFSDRYEQIEEALTGIGTAENPPLKEESGMFYRTELTSRHGWNASVLYDYNGTGIFSSTANVAVTKVFEKLGMAAWPAANRYHYQNSTPVNNAFLNLKYLISRGTEVVNQEYLTEAAKSGDVYVYENEAYLPIGFMVEKEMADFSLEGDTPFEIQNSLVKTATGTEEDVFQALDMIHVGHENVYVTRPDYGMYQYRPLESMENAGGTNQPDAGGNRSEEKESQLDGTRVSEGNGNQPEENRVSEGSGNQPEKNRVSEGSGNQREENRVSEGNGNRSEGNRASEERGSTAEGSQPSGDGTVEEKEKFKYNYEMPKDGAAYVFMDLRREKTAENTAKAEFNGASRPYAIYHNGSFFPAGTYQKGDMFSVRSEMDAGRSGKLRIFVSILNQEAFDRAYDMLKDETLEVTDWTSRSLKGNITVKKDNLMYTSIPYEKGWKVYVDGKRAEIKLIFDAFIGVELTEGEHEIELVYSPGHVYLAVVISLLGIGIFGLICLPDKGQDQNGHGGRKSEIVRYKVLRDFFRHG